jgi:hypothetical protein
MFNHKYLMALAMNSNVAALTVDNLHIPVKITNIDSVNSPSTGQKTTFECMVVNDDQITADFAKLAQHLARGTMAAKRALNSVYGSGSAKTPDGRQGGFVYVNPFQISKVIFNAPATIVFWADGTKTVVKCQEGNTYSKETGLATAIAKKALGNKGNFNDVFKKFIPEY